VAIYPTQAFYTSYFTPLPLQIAFLLGSVVLFCLLVFGLYDCLVSRESGRRQGVLEAKRRFVRFISHEIRTPLNTMHLGLDLFRIEMTNLASLVWATANGATEIPGSWDIGTGVGIGGGDDGDRGRGDGDNGGDAEMGLTNTDIQNAVRAHTQTHALHAIRNLVTDTMAAWSHLVT
ncbi:hypothetical protein B484DRAFT_409201, partial [Ochromonadaceae sp. CCMP2298]